MAPAEEARGGGGGGLGGGGGGLGGGGGGDGQAERAWVKGFTPLVALPAGAASAQ